LSILVLELGKEYVEYGISLGLAILSLTNGFQFNGMNSTMQKMSASLIMEESNHKTNWLAIYYHIIF
jgi:hypothetical protein